MRDRDILIIGTIPPPIGGVTIHVQRLLQFLTAINYSYNFIDIKRDIFSKAFWLFFKSKWIHLHTSNVYFRFFVTFISKVFNKKVIVTIHGNLGRFNSFKNYIDYLSIRLASIPVVINSNSFSKGKIMNNNMVLITAFIPPLEKDFLKEDIVKKISELQNSYETLYATNAYSLSYDKNGNEIYQVIMLVRIFKKLKKNALIVSDPSGAYLRRLEKINEQVSENIFFISHPHSFFEVLKLSDVFLRTTTTDGDSLSVKEAIYLGKNVIATNVVDRPKGVFLVDNNPEAIQNAIQNFIPYCNQVKLLDNGANLILQLYKKSVG